MIRSAARGRRPVYFLADGTPLGDAIKARGLNKVTVYSRLRRGHSPDEAAAVDPLPKGKPVTYRMRDGRSLSAAIRQADVSRRCVYYEVQAGLSPDDALASIADRMDRARLRREHFRTRRLGLSD
jgi:hypothetical protein